MTEPAAIGRPTLPFPFPSCQGCRVVALAVSMAQRRGAPWGLAGAGACSWLHPWAHGHADMPWRGVVCAWLCVAGVSADLGGCVHPSLRSHHNRRQPCLPPGQARGLPDQAGRTLPSPLSATSLRRAVVTQALQPLAQLFHGLPCGNVGVMIALVRPKHRATALRPFRTGSALHRRQPAGRQPFPRPGCVKRAGIVHHRVRCRRREP